MILSVPTSGICRTNAWYSLYRRLVSVVPMLGIRRTNAWYLPYLRLIPEWYR
ncbi:hypothetical protein [Bacteroides clarus]|uniref:hypothetical protein n=1 Tax=Bacteroides clarus TaxID=626929 RepID=UPI0026657DA8|nr:hypothetical protein [Bacteroides clarus]